MFFRVIYPKFCKKKNSVASNVNEPKEDQIDEHEERKKQLAVGDINRPMSSRVNTLSLKMLESKIPTEELIESFAADVLQWLHDDENEKK